MILGGIPIVSLDSIYLTCDGEKIIYLDCTRLDGENTIISRREPNNEVDVDNQIMDISDRLKNNGQTKIFLADDVVFSGSVLKNVISKFKSNQIEVIGIRSCISTVKAYESFNIELQQGLKCGYLLGKNNIDQICERDFYFGIVQSGISVRNKDGKIYKSPYFKPYGNPIERASIPSNYEKEFSRNCIDRSIQLWSKIDELKKILVSNLPENIKGVNTDEEVIRVLKKERKYI